MDSPTGKVILVHENNADPRDRNNLTLKISPDEGETWENPILIDGNDNPGNTSNTAYSDLVSLNNNSIGILYEKTITPK